MWINGSGTDNHVSYSGSSFLLGMDFKTGFSFRFNPYTSLDINGLIKFGFGSVNMEPYYNYFPENIKIISDLPSKSYWPFFPGIEVGLTYMFPYESRR